MPDNPLHRFRFGDFTRPVSGTMTVIVNDHRNRGESDPIPHDASIETLNAAGQQAAERAAQSKIEGRQHD
jgi:hypothetical protein